MMERFTMFVGEGIYTPHEFFGAIEFHRSLDDAPLFGVQVDSPQNAQRFSDVIVLDDNGDIVEYLAQERKSAGEE